MPSKFPRSRLSNIKFTGKFKKKERIGTLQIMKNQSRIIQKKIREEERKEKEKEENEEEVDDIKIGNREIKSLKKKKNE